MNAAEFHSFRARRARRIADSNTMCKLSVVMCDLNLPAEHAEEARERLATAARLGAPARLTLQRSAAQLCLSLSAGYTCVAVSRSVSAAQLGEARARCPLQPPAVAARSAGPCVLEHLTRLTVFLDDAADCSRLASAADVTRGYDLLAVSPASELAFASACTTLAVDIISIDLARRLPFKCVRLPAQQLSVLTSPADRFKVPAVRAAAARGVVFEMCYSCALREQSSRRQFIANATALVRAASGDAILLSSGALDALELRSPADVACLAGLFGLSEAAAERACRGLTALAVCARAKARRAAHRGGITVLAV